MNKDNEVICSIISIQGLEEDGYCPQIRGYCAHVEPHLHSFRSVYPVQCETPCGNGRYSCISRFEHEVQVARKLKDL